MFTESLCESNLQHPSLRSWTTLVSFGLQALAVSAVLTLPFLSTQGLPPLSFASHLMVPMRDAAVQVHTQQVQSSGAASIVPVLLVPPSYSTRGIPKPDDSDAGPPNLTLGNANMHGIGDPIGISNSIGRDVVSMPRLAPAPITRISVMMEGNLIHRVQPQYPPLAIQTHTQGAVVLSAVIGRDGSIENLQVVSGHPMLVPAAINAVRQWHYRPYVLNGEPIEVDTHVTVNFVLAGR
jgi:periplasmic protein TonB